MNFYTMKKRHAFFPSDTSSQAGFTLIELLVTLVVLSMPLMIVSGMLLNFLRGQSVSVLQDQIQASMTQVVNDLSLELYSATAVEANELGEMDGLKLTTFRDDEEEQLEYEVLEGQLWKNDQALHVSQISLEQFNVEVFQSGDQSPLVQISIKMTGQAGESKLEEEHSFIQYLRPRGNGGE